MESIQDYWVKIKALLEGVLRDWGVGILVVVIALSCFGLGRLSALEAQKTPISIGQAAGAAQALAAGGMYEASKAGSVYYFPWCTAAENIAPSEQIWFKSEAAAQKAGYTPAKNCKGLANSSQ